MKAHTTIINSLLLCTAAAQSVSWDTDSVTTGAQGATISPADWSSSAANWWNGSTNVPWSGSLSVATFDGTPGVVQVAGALGVRDFFFNTGNFTPPASSFAGAYEIKGATSINQPLTLTSNPSLGDFPDITVASNVRALLSLTHANTGFTGGVGFTKRGPGTFIIQHNTTTASTNMGGPITVAGGKMIFDSIVPTGLAGASVFPTTTFSIIAQNQATVQIDRSHALGGNPINALRKIRLESGSTLLFANSQQYFSEIELFGATIGTTTRETTSDGTDENDIPAILTPNGGLTFIARANNFDRSLSVPIDILEGPLTFNIEDGPGSFDYALNAQVRSSTGSTHAVTKTGPGTLRLNAFNPFQGDFLINEGLVYLNVLGGLGAATTSGDGEVRVASGGGVDLNGIVQNLNKSWFIAGTGPTGQGAIVNDSFNALTENSRIVNLTLTANAAIGGNGDFHIGRNPDTNSAGTITGGGFTLTKIGPNDVRVRAASTNITWRAEGGFLTAAVANAFGSNTIVVNNGGVRGVGNVTIPNNIDASFGGSLGVLSGTTTFTGTINQGLPAISVNTPVDAIVVFGDFNIVKAGPGPINKSGPGTAIFNGTHALLTATEGTIRGTGTHTGSLTIGQNATLFPGTTAAPYGTYTVNGPVEIEGSLRFTINGANSSKLVTTNTFGTTATSFLELAPGNVYTQPVYVLVEYAFLSGPPIGLPKPPPGYAFDLNYQGLNRIALVEASLSPYQTWITARGLAGPDALTTADPDGDGFTNLMEFVFGTEPNPANPNSNSAAFGPEIVLLPTNEVEISYRRSQLAAAVNTRLKYGVDLSNTATWDTAIHGQNGIVITSIPNGYATGIDKIRVIFPLTGNPIRFARVEVEE